MKRLIFIITALLVVLIAWWFFQSVSTPSDKVKGDSAAEGTEVDNGAEKSVPEIAAPKKDSRVERLEDGRVNFLPAQNVSREISASSSVVENMEKIQLILGQFRFAFGENPIGVENFEITEQLLGENPKRVVFLAPDSPALRGDVLIDNWGTPYFFHSLSAKEMEIVSAGPDRTWWTEDDIGALSKQKDGKPSEEQ